MVCFSHSHLDAWNIDDYLRSADSPDSEANGDRDASRRLLAVLPKLVVVLYGENSGSAIDGT